MHSQGKYVINNFWWSSLFRLVQEKKIWLCMQLSTRYCCSFESFACCNLAKHLSAAPQTAPALQQKPAVPVYHTGLALVVYIPKEQQRVTGVCVQYKLLSARHVWVRLGRKEQAKFKLHVKNRWDLNTYRNAQVQTLCSRQSQQTLDQFDTLQGQGQ